MEKLILASSSPRRAELFRRLGLDFEIVVPGIVEQNDPNIPPEDIVAMWSRRKAAEVARRFASDRIIIAADTVVWHDGEVLGKPHNRDEAFRMLRLLAGGWHNVYTGLTVQQDETIQTQEEISMVHMRPLTDAEIWRYVDTGEPMDKAGAYGIQEKGALLVDRIDGDFYNVMGMPLYRLSMMLEEFGINIMGR